MTYHRPNDARSASVEATFDLEDISALKATDYSIKVTDAAATPPTFEVTRKDDGSLVDFEFEDTSDTLSFGGVNVVFTDFNTAQNGDRFEVQPVRRAAGGMDSNITDLDKIAAASLVEREGDLEISQLTAASGAFSANESYELSVDDTGKLTVTATTAATITKNGTVFDPATELLAVGDTISIDGLSFTLDAFPTAGEASLAISRSDASAGDNRNALSLQNMQAESIVGGSASVSGAYASIVSDVGNRTNIIQVNLDARQGLTDQLKAVQQSESGVSLDEEAANLIRFQQYYQANARVIDTASNIFDTILGSILTYEPFQ